MSCREAEITASKHPCYSAESQHKFARMHLPVAPACNIQCNYCNRQYDCVNESRPGVTRHLLEPAMAVEWLDQIMAKRQDISVAGIAGPGDPLCNPDLTLKTLEAVHQRHPELLLCVSTNGLNLTEHIDELLEIGVTHLTVTVNAVDPAVAGEIYRWVRFGGHTYEGVEGARLLLERQDEALCRLREKNVIVKVNTVMLPGVNWEHIPAIAERAAEWKADIMNCIPLIPVHDTPFETLKMPAAAEVERLRGIAGDFVPQMHHCNRCRADAVGQLKQPMPECRPAIS